MILGMSAVRLYRVIVPVSDITAAVAFYSKVLDIPGVRVSRGRHYFDCGGTILACFDPRADGDDFDARNNPDHVYLSVPDLETCLRRVRTAGGRIVRDIKTQPWGERCFYVHDPFGNPLSSWTRRRCSPAAVCKARVWSELSKQWWAVYRSPGCRSGAASFTDRAAF